MYATPTPLIVILLTAGILGCQSPDSPGTSAPKPLDAFGDNPSTLTTTVREQSPRSVVAQPLAEATIEPTLINDHAGTPSIEAPAAYEPELGGVGGVAVRRLVTATDVEAREPVEAAAVFGSLQRVYAFLEVSNDAAEATSLTVNFIGPSGQVRGGMVLAVPAESLRWRTWAYTERAEEHGLWRVEVRSDDGTLVGTLPYEVGPGC